jgi:pyridoxine kinase
MEERAQPWQGRAMAVLSIQSQVAFGAIGNRAAVFALERLGIETWAVPTVLYSNHTGHHRFRGERLAADKVSDLIAGIVVLADWRRCQAILTGYAADPAGIAVAAQSAAQLRARNPDGFLACNAAFGNEEGLFVPDAVARATCERLFPEAGLLFLNQAELEYASGRAVAGPADAVAAARALGRPATKIVVVTSVRPNDASASTLTLALGADGCWSVETPRLPGPAHGAGDLFSALYLAHTLKGATPAEALERSVASTFGVIARTGEALDLALVQAQDELVAPTRRFSVRTF